MQAVSSNESTMFDIKLLNGTYSEMYISISLKCLNILKLAN